MFDRTTVSGFYTYPSDQLCKVQIAKHMRKIAIVAPLFHYHTKRPPLFMELQTSMHNAVKLTSSPPL